MKKFIISEDERSRILSMHESATKRQYLSEQGVSAPASTANKGVEQNNFYVKNDKTGKILSQNPKFVELANKNNINLRLLKFSKIGDGNTVMWVPEGTNKYHYFGWKDYNGQNYAGAKQKEEKAFKKLQEYYSSVVKNPSLKKCVRPDRVALTDNKQQECQAVNQQFKKIEKDTNYNNLKYLSSIQDFVELGPKWKTA